MMDGDIDPNWIESMNSVMDDSKILTLASNERISLSPTTRLIFEVCVCVREGECLCVHVYANVCACV